MTANSPLPTLFSPAVHCLIPLIYVAWADQVLSPTEVKILQDQAGKLSFLEKADRSLLLRWTDPAQPPSRDLFKLWEIELRRIADSLPDDNKYSLVDLGLEMATQAAAATGTVKKQVVNWSSPGLRAELEALEEALKSVSLETYASIFEERTFGWQREEELSTTSFPVKEMKKLLDGEYVQICDRMRQLLKDPVFRRRTLRDKEDYRAQVLEWCQMLARQGLGAVSFPEAYGGSYDMGTYAAVFEMLGYCDLSLTVKYGVQFGLFGGSVLWLGTRRHHEKYLADIGDLTLPGCFAMTETGHGSNVRGLETTAVYDPASRGFVVNTPRPEAGKEYIGNALHGRMATVFAQLIVDGDNKGVHALLVPLRDGAGRLLPGIRVEDCGYKMGLNGVDNGRIWFDQVQVPRENLLNRFGDVDEQGRYQSPIESPSRRFFTMLGTLVGGRVCVPRAGISATKSALTIAVKYALKRRQFAPEFHKPESLLLDYPSHQRRLMPLLAKTYAIDIGLSYLTSRYIQRSDSDIREIETLAAGLKSYATWFTTAAIQECREACGGKGYLSENRFADLKADTDVFTTFEGDNTVLMQLVAKGVLSEFRKEFYEEGNRAILRYLGRRVNTAIKEKNPFIIRNTDPEHLRDNDFLLNAFRFRENKLLYSLAQRMRGLIKDGRTSYQAYLRCQTHMLQLSEAFAERVILEQFIEKVRQQEQASLRTILEKLCDLFALYTIEQHKGWFLEQDYMTAVKTKAIRRLVDQLCMEIRQEASGLVEAFAIPDECLAAPIVVD